MARVVEIGNAPLSTAVMSSIDESCLLAIATRWEFDSPQGGGIIVGRRAFAFPPVNDGGSTSSAPGANSATRGSL